MLSGKWWISSPGRENEVCVPHTQLQTFEKDVKGHTRQKVARQA